MDNSLLILQYIQDILAANETLTEIVPEDKIFSLIATTNVEAPFIVMQRSSITTQYTKDRYPSNTVSFTITVVASDYKTCVTIANYVRDAVENYFYQDDNIRIHPISLIGAYEEFSSDGFVETLSFETMVY